MTEKSSNKELEKRIQELKTDYSQLENKLLESRTLTEEIMTYMTEGLVLTDTRGTVIFINQRLSEMLGYLSEEIIGKCWLEIVPPEQQAIAQAAEARRAQGYTDRYEIFLRHKEGREFPVLIGAGPRLDKQSGEFIGTMGVVTDITERKLAEEALRESETRYKALHNASFGGIAIHDQGIILECNQGLSEMTGYQYSELIGMNGLLLIAEKSREKVMNNIRAGYEKSYEAFGLRKNGEEFPIRLEARNVPYKGKQVRTVEFTDITERKKVEEMLQKNENKLQMTLDATPFPIAVVDLKDDNIFYWNPRALKLFGHTAPTASEWYQIAYPDPGYRQEVISRWKPFLEKARESGLPVNTGEYRVTCKDGSERICELYATFIPDNLIVTFNDITHRKSAEEDLKQIFSMSLDMICIADINTATFRKVNPAFTEILGHSENTFLSKSFLDFVHTDDIDATRTVIEQQLKAGDKVINFENRYRCKDGSYRWLNWVSHPNPEKGVTYAIAHDITEWKQNEETLKKNKALLDATGRMARVGGWEVYVDTMEVIWTDETYRIHEIPFGQRPSLQDAIDFFDPEDRPQLELAIQRALDHGEPYDLEIRFITAKGKHLWTRTKCQPEVVDGKTVKLQGTFQDITERKEAEDAFRKSEERLQLVIKGSNDAPWDWDLISNELYYSPQWWFQLGYTPDELPADAALWERLMHPEDSNHVDSVNRGALQNDLDSYEVEFRLLHKNGHYVPVLSRGVITRDETGKPIRITGTNMDLTNHKKAKEEQEKLQEQLNQAQKMESVGRLAGGVAHDFNNMLGVILGHTELALLQADENHDLCSDLKEIQKAAKRSADITKKLLAFARKETISPRQLDLNNTVESMLNMLRRLIGEDIDLAWQPAAPIWPVKMDPSQIDQILANLCVNARDAISGVGKLTIETGRKTFDEEYCKEHEGFIPGDFVLLGVSDNGCGIDKETLENLFEPFFTTKDVGKGTGLGLATVYGIVKQNNGFINVYSEPGYGSTFKIYLPRLVVDEDLDKVMPEKKAVAGGTESILLVEDEPSILRMTRIMLERKGYSVLPAATPGEAIDLAKTHSDKIHLLMTDVVMPEMNGRDLAGKITALQPGIRLLFMSGYTANVIAHQGVLDAVVAFIQKPFSMTDMTEKVRNVLDSAPDKNQGYPKGEYSRL